MYSYSAKNNAFYLDEMFETYEKSGLLPDDLVSVTESEFAKYSQNPPDGKVRAGDEDGMPSWVDAPPKSDEQIEQESVAQRSHLKSVADSEISWRQDAVDAEIATDEEIADLAKWKKYRVLLMRVDVSNPEWPALPE